MKKISHRRLFIATGILAVLILIPTIVVWQKSQQPPKKIGNKVKVKGFKYREPGQASCLVDQAPECGYCAGEIIDKNCYVEAKQ